MVKCKAVRDGLLGTAYIHAGEEFLIDKCPRWAVVVVAKKSAPKRESEPKQDSKPKETAGA